MISICLATNRPGGLDVLVSCLRGQSCHDFELVIVDELRPERRGVVPQVGKGSWHIAPGGGERNGRYMHALNRAVQYSRGDVLLFWSDYTAPHPETIAQHVKFHSEFPETAVMLGGIEYCETPKLHPDFPNRYGWSAIGHDVANHRDETYAPWLDDKRRHELYLEWASNFDADLAEGKLAPFMFSVFDKPVDGWPDVAPLRVFQSNPRVPPHQFLNLKNDSMRRSLLEKIGGFDERADGSHGHQDSITHRQLAKVGATFHPVAHAPVKLLDPHNIAILRRFDGSKDDSANLKLAEALQ